MNTWYQLGYQFPGETNWVLLPTFYETTDDVMSALTFLRGQNLPATYQAFSVTNLEM
jgi:hypothetical protein